MQKVETGEIVVYQPDEITRLEVRVEGDTVWLTQEQIALLFGVKRPAITKHIRNIFSSQELEETSVCSILERTASDGKIYMTQTYNIHDRFLIIDNDVYHIGASLKDLGKKLFAFSKMGLLPESVLVI